MREIIEKKPTPERKELDEVKTNITDIEMALAELYEANAIPVAAGGKK